MAQDKFIGTGEKAHTALLMLRACILSILFFASFTGSLYFPHKSIWWRISELVLAGMMLFSTVQSYGRRKRRKAKALRQAVLG